MCFTRIEMDDHSKKRFDSLMDKGSAGIARKPTLDEGVGCTRHQCAGLVTEHYRDCYRVAFELVRRAS